jgi:glycine cleavage system H protein
VNIPENLKYTREHEWVLVEDGTGTFGITDYAQSELGDIVFVELPQVGDRLEAGGAAGTIEAVKTVADLFSPVSGEVLEVNEALDEDPDRVNRDPYGDGWMVKVALSEADEVDGMLSPEDYAKLIEE